MVPLLEIFSSNSVSIYSAIIVHFSSILFVKHLYFCLIFQSPLLFLFSIHFLSIFEHLLYIYQTSANNSTRFAIRKRTGIHPIFGIEQQVEQWADIRLWVESNTCILDEYCKKQSSRIGPRYLCFRLFMGHSQINIHQASHCFIFKHPHSCFIFHLL